MGTSIRSMSLVLTRPKLSMVCLGLNLGQEYNVGVDAAEHFFDALQEYLNMYSMSLIEKGVGMIWDGEARERFLFATHCHVCKKELNRMVEQVVRDHCHFNGEFRGAVHQHCNLNYKIDKSRYKRSIVFHNLRGYDAHLIFKKIKGKHGKITVIPNNSERYISLDVCRLKFRDSMQFLSYGLDELAKQSSNDQFKHLMAAHPEQWDLQSKKGIYCYDYMNSVELFDETSLSSNEHIFNKLAGEHISEEQYEHAENVWKTLKCNTMKGYLKYYFIT